MQCGRQSLPDLLSLDMALGVGGVLQGTYHRDLLPESAVRQPLHFAIIGEVQKRGGDCRIIDAEHALDPAPCKEYRCRYR